MPHPASSRPASASPASPRPEPSRPVSALFVEYTLRLIACLPLAVLRAAGAVGGLLVYLLRPRVRQRMQDNLRTAGLPAGTVGWRAAADTGIGALETIWIWFHSDEDLVRRTRCDELASVLMRPGLRSERPGGDLHGDGRVAKPAHGDGSGAQIVLTPHLGAWELAGRMVGRIRPITVLYKVPRQTLLQDLIRRVRTHSTMTPAPAEAGGVRSMLDALRRGRFVGILPDQVPTIGDGVWAPFLGRDAYTMTLPTRLAERTSAPVSIVAAWRRPGGWAMEARPVLGGGGTRTPSPAEINQAVEALIRRCPVQYLWSYNRFKRPAGAMRKDDPATVSAMGAGD